MKMIKFENFLCCFRLSTGGYFVGIAGIVISLFSMMGFISGLSNYDGFVREIGKFSEKMAEFFEEHKSGKPILAP